MAVPYLISGTVKYGPREGYGEYATAVDTSLAGETVNLQLDAGTSVKSGMTVSIRNVTQNETKTTTSDANGNYAYDLANMTTSYTNGDSLLIWSEDISATDQFESDDSTATYKPTAHAKVARVVIPGRKGKEYTENYPIPVNIMNLLINSENPSSVYTYSGGVLATETATIEGIQYSKTYTWSGGNLTNESAWVKV